MGPQSLVWTELWVHTHWCGLSSESTLIGELWTHGCDMNMLIEVESC